MVLLVVTLFVPMYKAVTPDALIGTWRLVSATDMNEKGERSYAYGRDPSGLITYTADGRMMALIANEGDRLYLAVEKPFLKGGRYVRQELVWARVRPSKSK